MTRKRPDFDRSMQFCLDCPGCPDPDAEGKRRFRECLISLTTLLAEWIAESEADCITPHKEMKPGAGFPFAIELSIDKSWWDYLLTVKASRRGRSEDENMVDAAPEVNVLPEPDYSYMDCIEWR